MTPPLTLAQRLQNALDYWRGRTAEAVTGQDAEEMLADFASLLAAVPQEPQAQECPNCGMNYPTAKAQRIWKDENTDSEPAPSRLSAEALERRIARIASRACTGQQGESQIEYEIEELLKDALSTAPAPAQGWQPTDDLVGWLHAMSVSAPLPEFERKRLREAADRLASVPAASVCPCGHGNESWHWPRNGVCKVGAEMPLPAPPSAHTGEKP